jgi:2-oxoisovalerate dehydrogenase E1 component alpha subunit
MRALKHAEGLKRHELSELFSDMYGGEEPLNLVGVSPPFSVSGSRNLTLLLFLQKEQREELIRLLQKYGNAWGPWKAELKKFKDNGESLLGRVGSTTNKGETG